MLARAPGLRLWGRGSGHAKTTTISTRFQAPFTPNVPGAIQNETFLNQCALLWQVKPIYEAIYLFAKHTGSACMLVFNFKDGQCTCLQVWALNTWPEITFKASDSKSYGEQVATWYAFTHLKINGQEWTDMVISVMIIDANILSARTLFSTAGVQCSKMVHPVFRNFHHSV